MREGASGDMAILMGVWDISGISPSSAGQLLADLPLPAFGCCCRVLRR